MVKPSIPEYLTRIHGYDPSYIVAYANNWCTYEETGWLAILEREGVYFELRGGYSVMGEGSQDAEWEPYPITLEYALTQIEEFEATVERIDDFASR